MALLIWLLCLTVGGSFAFQCAIVRLCPKFLEFFDCYFAEVEKCILRSIPELATTGHEFASQLLAARNFTVDLCNENSTLHNDYVSNTDCILDVSNPELHLYDDEAEKLLKAFSESKGPLQTAGKNRETILNERFCLETFRYQLSQRYSYPNTFHLLKVRNRIMMSLCDNEQKGGVEIWTKRNRVKEDNRSLDVTEEEG
ncbi:hypothetical protein HNY73_016149 [Argiope bruennichi]|uniref:Uncharacterized protein n=1 Tax=Argiope bruennichi TaxID=94029 RepID=A0A8T0EI22_ARGBR|nr:hypothetical protein HNY73_016149 [Argiope bruennichi]